MNEGRDDFHKRLERLEKTKRVSVRHNPNAAHGGGYNPGEDERRQKKKFSVSRLIMTVLFSWIVLIGIKVFIAEDMGEDAYQARIADLADGNRYEKAAAVLISRGPIMSWMERVALKKDVNDSEAIPQITPADPS